MGGVVVIIRTRLSQQSDKRRAQQGEYDRARQKVFERDRGTCQAANVWPEIECWGVRDPHHVWPQGVYPERRCDPDAQIVLCRGHHDAVHFGDPIRARQLGLLK